MLSDTAKELVRCGIRPNTRKVYDSAQQQYIHFCDKYGLQTVPASENTILLYIAHMYIKTLKASTMKVYLASIRMMHIESSYCYDFDSSSRIQLALCAVQMDQAPPKRKLPITLAILCQIYYTVESRLSDYNVLLIWSAMCMAHFGCMRSGEFTISESFNPKTHLTRSDLIFVSSSLQNMYVKVHLKSSKTDIYNDGVDIIIGCTGRNVCGYCSLRRYCDIRDKIASDDSALFIYQNGQMLSRELLIRHTRTYLAGIGVNPDQFSGHSYRIGSATTAAISGFQDWEIKKLGRWKSNVYTRYIRPSNVDCSKFTGRMQTK